MSDPFPTPDADGLDDEIVEALSARLDGEAAAPGGADGTAWEERAQDLGRRLRDVPPAPPDLVELHVRAALAAAGRADAAADPTAPVDLAARRARRRWQAPLVGVAAAATLLVGAVAAVGSLGSVDGDSATDLADTPRVATTAVTADGGRAEVSAPAPNARADAMAGVVPVDLGEFPDPTTLLEAWAQTTLTAGDTAREESSTTPAVPPTGPETGVPCPGVMATGRIAGRAVAVVVIGDGDPRVVDATTCQTIAGP